MRPLRGLGYLALALGYAQVVFGAVVRITGSGMGCGDNWPDCHGAFTPVGGGTALLIELSHRYGAVLLSLAILTLIVAAFLTRRTPGVSGPGGVLRPAVAAGVLVLAAALFGAASVRLELQPIIVVTHLAIAMLLLGAIVVALVRAGGLGAGVVPADGFPRTLRAGKIAVGLTFATLVFGALTANVAGAPLSCGGFPWCRVVDLTDGGALAIQIVHRILGFFVLGHLIGMNAGSRKRREHPTIRIAVGVALGLAVTQILIAAGMVEMTLPATLRSMHQAVGTAVWIAVVTVTALAARRRSQQAPLDIVRESPSRGVFGTPEGMST